MPNKVSGNGYCALLDHTNGAAHYGAWCAIVLCCSLRERSKRGTLPEADGTIGGICRSLSRISRLPPSLFAEVLPRLINDPEIQWIEPVPDESENSPGMSGENPDASGKSSVYRTGQTGQDKQDRQQQQAPQPLPPLPSISEWPLTRSEIRKRDPAIDDLFVRRLAQETMQYLISIDDGDPFDDEDLARAVAESYSTYRGKNGHGSGLLLSRVPRILHNWGEKNGQTN